MMTQNTLNLKRLKQTLFYIAIAFIAIIILFPFIYTISVSFMPKTDIESFPIRLFPTRFVFDNYRFAINYQPIMRYILNSFIIAMLAVVINLTISLMSSYSLERTQIRLKRLFLFLILAMTLLPGITIIQPIYNMFSKNQLLDTYGGIAVLTGILDLPMSIWFLTALFKQVPRDFEESAVMDGANLFDVFRHIYFPLLKPGLFSIGIIVFINSWNQFLLAQILNPQSTHRTVVVALTIYQNDFEINFGVLAAASMLTMGPILLIVFLFQKKIIDNVLKGGVKG